MSKPPIDPSEKTVRQTQAILTVEERFLKRAVISIFPFIVLLGYLILGGFFLSNQLEIFWPTAAVAFIAMIALLVWSHLWRYAISTYSSMVAMIITLVVIIAAGWAGISLWAAGPNGDGQTYIGEHTWLIIVLGAVVLAIAAGVALLVYTKLEKYINTHWADRRLKQHLGKQFDEELGKLDSDKQ